MVATQLLRNIPSQAPFLSQSNFAKSRWWNGNQANKKEAKKTGLFIASKISFTAKRSLKQKYQLAGWHPQPEFSFNHMVAQCQISAGAYSFPPSAFQVLSIAAVFLPLSLTLWDTSRLFLQIFFSFLTFYFLDHQHWYDLYFLKHFSFSSGKFMSLSGICPLSSLHTQAKNSFLFFFFFPLNNALTTCVNKLPLPFLRGPSVSFTALSFRMYFKNVLFILTPAAILLCSILHLCFSYHILHQLCPLIFTLHCWTPYFIQNYVLFSIIINPVESHDSL